MYYTKDTIIYLSGKFVKAMDAHADLYSQTLHYGYGVFEGIRAYQTVNGIKLFKPREHYDRLKKIAESIGISFPYDINELIQITYQLITKNYLSDAYIRPLMFCGQNMTLDPSKEASLMIGAWKWGKYHGDGLLKICISSHQRPNPSAFKLEGKVTGVYVNAIMATNEAKKRGYDESLMLDMNGNVAQAPSSNFFYEKDRVLYTAPLGHIFPGITRQTVIGICRELDIPVREKFFKPEELNEADSAFLCGTAVEIAGVESVDAKPFRKKWKDSLGASIQEAFKCQALDKSYTHVII